MRAHGSLGVSLAVLVVLAGCNTAATPSSAPSAAASAGGGGPVTAALSEFKIELGATSAPAGPVTFTVTNKGTTVHEFVIFKTDLAIDRLPLSSDGTEVEEDGEGLTAIDEVEDVAVGADASLPVTLAAGRYVMICNIPAHYTSGMRTEFTAS
jgi:uncharacterized cupredoxin-like copper-binding protein